MQNGKLTARRAKLAELLSGPRPVLLDGSTGNYLMRHCGLPAGECVERWILKNPQHILKLQRGYVAAGTQILCAPTFGANRESLSKYGLGGEVRGYCERLVGLCREAAGGEAFVAGDISMTGQFLPPYGETGYGEMFAVFAEQAEAMRLAGVDLFLIETQMNLAEARCALAAVRSVSQAPVFVSMTVDARGRTMSGNSMEACLASLYAAGADVVGCNCSVGPAQMLETMRGLAPLAQGYIPLLAKANAGLPHDDGCGGVCFDCDSGGFARVYADILACGVKFIGGCCGSDPEYIAKLRELADRAPDCNLGAPAADGGLGSRCATERELCGPIDLSTGEIPRIIECGPGLQDGIMDARDDEVAVIRILLQDASDAADIAECSAYIDRPLMLGSADGDALLAAALQYPGRIAVDPACSAGVTAKLTGGYKPIIMNN